MYEYILGKITNIKPTYLVVEAGGVGYRVHISLNTFTAFQNKKEGKIFIHQVVKEDSNDLIRFTLTDVTNTVVIQPIKIKYFFIVSQYLWRTINNRNTIVK
ncbi:MAG: hypothetical protein KGV44_07645 [Flavobacteriaceae bacterium]|nr:hypothetical protein [Flavobacteriaceae bacterium]